jgi:hypothetical protein
MLWENLGFVSKSSLRRYLVCFALFFLRKLGEIGSPR